MNLKYFIMQNSFKYTFIFFLIGMFSCTDFLDRSPLDQLSEETFYQSAADAEKGVISMYAIPGGVNWYGKSWMITEIPSDNTTAGGNDPDFSPIDNFTLGADNGPNSEFWTERFKLVAAANQILKFIPNIPMAENLRTSFLGEARFLRAFAYFDLVRIYGDVPIITQIPDISTNVLVPRDPVAKVYDFIIEDLKFAITSLPGKRPAGEAGRASSDAAKAILAKVYLTTKSYDKAMELSRELIAAADYKLMPEFGQNFLKETSDNNDEAIFQIQYVGCKGIGVGNALQAFFAPWGQSITKGSDGWGSQIPTAPSVDNPGTTIKDVYGPKDKRKYHSIMSPLDEYPMINQADGGYMYPPTGASRSGINIKKYVIGGGPDVCFMSTPQNYHVVRFADVLLTLAEASCARNGGVSVTPDVVDAFNRVTTRAGLDAVQSVTTESVFLERRREFAFENQRWFDLLRQGNVMNTMLLHGKPFKAHNILFPIPSQDLAINPNLKQNPGYN
jgi:starch-binding outer membrane protein, SusD/RagB family